MEVLVVGAGVIGTVYGAVLADAGHRVSVLRHGPRTDEIAQRGLVAVDLTANLGQQAQSEQTMAAAVAVVDDASAETYDLVLVAVWATHADSAEPAVRALRGHPVVAYLGNTIDPAAEPAADLGGTKRATYRVFPGIGGALEGGVVRFVRIGQQPTTFPRSHEPQLADLEDALVAHGFAVAHTDDMAGWLAHHAVFIAAIASSLRTHGDDAAALASDPAGLDLMCRAMEEGFDSLRSRGVGGLPRNLRVLHTPLLRPVARRYWAHTMASELGERCFAAHARHARPEMDALAQWVLSTVAGTLDTGHLRRLLTTAIDI